MSVTFRERMAIAMSRELGDHEVVLTGAASAVPLAASLLAQRSHAPGLTVLGAGVYINPQRLVPEFSAGWDCRPTAVGDLGDVFAITELGIDVMFYGGMQIDEFGCVNVHEVTTPKGPLRGPGMANTMLGHTAKRTILFTERHDPRTLVRSVDFASVIGHARRGRTRSELGLPNTGPAALFTPAVLMRPNADGAFRPDLAFDDRPWSEVVAGTGWSFQEQRPPRFHPTEEELTLLRSSVDPDGLLRAQG
ncbi:hypothetical protein [Arthrobacter sp. NPDC058127]|uniref:hypothetical protein n=1 Tax=Arthrobacter sp. NPDC058127 TaxID=3346351 RepID=UPI0036EE4D56